MSGANANIQATDAIVQCVRRHWLDLCDCESDLGESDRVEMAVVKALGDPGISWALAYVAGVTMAPDLLRLVKNPGHPGAYPGAGSPSGAHSGAGQPPEDGGG